MLFKCGAVWETYIIRYSAERGEGESLELFFFLLSSFPRPITPLYLWVMNRSCSVVKQRRSGLLPHLRGTFLHLVVCFRPWRAHLNPTLLFPAAAAAAAAAPQSSWVLLVAMEDARKWRGRAVRMRRGRRACAVGVCACVYVYVLWRCVKCLHCVLNHPCAKVSALCLYVCVWMFLCVFGGSQQSKGRGEHLHTVAQAFCLYTRLLPSNASRPSRLWPPRGSRGALPLKSQLCLILYARQIFHSPAVHLRSMEHRPLTSSILYFWRGIVRV